jgi:hypothetical protein
MIGADGSTTDHWGASPAAANGIRLITGRRKSQPRVCLDPTPNGDDEQHD